MEFWRRKKEKGKARKCFQKNGSMFLQQLIADCNGISNPIRMFSSRQIYKATSHFDPKCSLPTNSPAFTWYKVVIEGRSYLIKRFIKLWHGDDPYNDIVLSARVCNYCGFLRPIGCCLEFCFPVLVFEDLEIRFLNVRGSVGCEDAPLLPWKARLKIAKEVATSIAYLHTAFPRIIIHRDIKVDNVFLDKNGTAKLTELSLSVTLPEGKSWIELKEPVSGTFGYMDPTYLETTIVTEYTDVFSFGILMLVLLLGRPALLDESVGRPDHDYILYRVEYLKERREPVEFGGDSNEMRPGQMIKFLDLALRCCEERIEDRPKMISVAKEIKLIESVDSEVLENGSKDGHV